jgi:transcriptional regulator with XRE-family HTH domain
MTTPPQNPLAQRLRDARGGMLSKVLAEQTGMTPSKVSKIETGRQLPTEDDLQLWANATHVGPGVLGEWTSMLEQIKADHSTFAEQLRHGQVAAQRVLTEMIARCHDFRYYQKLVVPRALQTIDYTRGIVENTNRLHPPAEPATAQQLDEAVAERQKITGYLYDPTRHFQFILDEAVLRTFRFSPQVMRAQLMRLQAVIGLPNVRFGILPLDRFVTETGNNSYTIYEDTVFVEHVFGQDTYVRADAVQAYRDDLDRLWTEAVEGAEALDLIEQIRQSIPDS